MLFLHLSACKFILHFLSLFKNNVYSYLFLSIIQLLLSWVPPILLHIEFLFLYLPFLFTLQKPCFILFNLVYSYFCFLGFFTELFKRGM